MSAKEKCEDKKDESEECEETDGIQYSDNDINNFTQTSHTDKVGCTLKIQYFNQ